MEDDDFDHLRLGLNRSRKKIKANLPKISMGDPIDVNGYVGPWGDNLKDSFKPTCGPSEVNMIYHLGLL